MLYALVEVTTYVYLIIATVKEHVLFWSDFAVPARRVVMTKILPARVTPGDIVDITCETDSANPTATITWSRNSLIINQDDMYTVTIDEKPGEYYANHRLSILSFAASQELLGSVFNCVVLGQKFTLKAGGSTLKGVYVSNLLYKNLKFKVSATVVL